MRNKALVLAAALTRRVLVRRSGSPGPRAVRGIRRRPRRGGRPGGARRVLGTGAAGLPRRLRVRAARVLPRLSPPVRHARVRAPVRAARLPRRLGRLRDPVLHPAPRHEFAKIRGRRRRRPPDEPGVRRSALAQRDFEMRFSSSSARSIMMCILAAVMGLEASIATAATAAPVMTGCRRTRADDGPLASLGAPGLRSSRRSARPVRSALFGPVLVFSKARCRAWMTGVPGLRAGRRPDLPGGRPHDGHLLRPDDLADVPGQRRLADRRAVALLQAVGLDKPCPVLVMRP